MARKPAERRTGYRPKVAGAGRTPQTESTAPEPEATAPGTETTEPIVVVDPTKSAEATTAAEATSAVEAAKVSTPAESDPVGDTPASDAGVSDAGVSDAGVSDAGVSDAGVSEPTRRSVSLKKPGTVGESADQAGDESTVDVAAEPDEAVTPKPAGKKRTVARVSTIKPQPDAAAKNSGRRGASAPKSKGDKESRGPSGWRSTRAVAIVGAVAVVLGIVALVLGLHPGADIGPNKAFINRAATTDLTSQAQTKICQVNSARSKDFDKWVASVRTMITGEALAQFDKAVPAIKEQFGQQEVTNDCKVDAVGVQFLSGDGEGATAEVMVNFIVSGTANGVPTQSLISRYQVSLVKHGDQWLIEKFADL